MAQIRVCDRCSMQTDRTGFFRETVDLHLFRGKSGIDLCVGCQTSLALWFAQL